METIKEFVTQYFGLLVSLLVVLIVGITAWSILKHKRKPSQEKFGKQIVKRIRKIGTPYSWSMSSSPSHAPDEQGDVFLKGSLSKIDLVDEVDRLTQLLQVAHDKISADQQTDIKLHEDLVQAIENYNTTVKEIDRLKHENFDCEQLLKLAEMHLEEEQEKRRFDVEKHSMLFAVKTNKQVETALLRHIKEYIRVDGNMAYIYIATPKK